MNILIIGYGKMGKMVEEVAIERGHKIVHVIDNDYDWKTLEGKRVDMAIDFSIPMLADYNIMECFERDIPVVVGTTGWYSKLPNIREFAMKNDKALFIASNFSVGMFIFNQINEKLAKLMNNQPEYEVGVEETHHIHKLDAPSGTAITLADGIMENLDRKKKWRLIEDEMDEEVVGEDSDLIIRSFREGNVTGEHIITYKSDIDNIIITHSANNRMGFARGAVLAAEFLLGKKGFYTMKDMIE